MAPARSMRRARRERSGGSVRWCCESGSWGIEHRTFNIEHRISNKGSRPAASFIHHSMFDVGCSAFPFLKRPPSFGADPRVSADDRIAGVGLDRDRRIHLLIDVGMIVSELVERR